MLIYIIDYNSNRVVAILDDSDLGFNYVYSLDISKDGNYLLTEYSTTILMRKISPSSSFVDNPPPVLDTQTFGINHITGTKQIQLNISAGRIIQISFDIFDILGRIVYTSPPKTYLPGSYSEIIELLSLSNGIYFVTARIDYTTKVFKLLMVE